MKRLRLSTICLPLALLLGCQGVFPSLHDAEHSIDSQAPIIGAPDLQRPVQPDKAEGSHLIVLDRPLIFTRNNRYPNGKPLPATLETKDGVALDVHASMTLAEMIRRIQSIAAIPVGIGNISGYIPTNRGADIAANATPAESALSTKLSGIVYQGPLSALLDTIAARMSLSWEYDGTSISFYRYITRDFFVNAIPSTTQIQSDISTAVTGTNNTSNGSSTSATGAAGSTTLSSTKISSSQKIDIWSDLKGSLDAMLPPASAATIFPSAGRITVTTTPVAMAEVARFIDKVNTDLGKLIYIRFDILALTLQDEDDYSVDLSAMLKTAGSALNYTLTSPSIAISSAAGALSGKIANPNSTSGFQDALSNSSAILSAISTKLHVLDHIGQTMETFNDRVASAQNATSTAYIQSAAAVPITAGNGVATTGVSLTPNTVVTGFNITALPRVVPNGAIAINANISISNLQSLPSFSSDGITVQTPVVDSRSNPYDLVVPNGQTAIIAVSDHRTASVTKTGIGTPETSILGGGKVGSNNRIIILALVTPWVVNSPISPNTAALNSP